MDTQSNWVTCPHCGQKTYYRIPNPRPNFCVHCSGIFEPEAPPPTQTWVWPCGTKVKMVEVEVNGIITGIVLRAGAVCYEVSFWANSEYKGITVFDYELEVADGTAKTVVGFK